MYQGKHSAQPVESTGSAKPVRSAAPRRRSTAARKPLGLIVALALILCVALGGTVAWLTHQASITNTMVPGSVPVKISENIDNTNKIKNQIFFTNTGNVQAYLRVAVISNTLEEGAIKPGTSSSDVPYDSELWQKIGDYYYYRGIVEPNGTVNLLSGGTIGFSNSEVVVMAQTVQALGTIGSGTASQALWGHTCTYDKANNVWSWT